MSLSLQLLVDSYITMAIFMLVSVTFEMFVEKTERGILGQRRKAWVDRLMSWKGASIK